MSADDAAYDPELDPEYLPVEWVPHDEIEPNDWNPNELDEDGMKKLRQSILDNGWTMPIVVHAEEHYIIDGEHRWKAAQDIDDPDLTPPDVPAGHVPVYGITVEEEQAKLATVQHNRARGDVQVDRLQDYLRDLKDRGVLDVVHDRIGYGEDDAAEILGEIGGAELPEETMPWEDEEDEEDADADEDEEDTEEESEEPVTVELHEDRTAALRGDPSDEVLRDSERLNYTLTESEYDLACRALGSEMRAQSLVNIALWVYDEGAIDEVVEYEPSKEL